MNDVSVPLNITQLNERLVTAADRLRIPVARARVMLCTLIVSQMLPEAAAVKGGMGIKLRLGELGTRATSDLDISAPVRDQAFQQEFSERLAVGWGRVPPSKGALKKNPDAPERIAFTATIRAMKTHDPGLTRPEYVMHPYRVSIAFLGTSWGGLDVEVSDPELEAGFLGSRLIDSELLEFGSYFGFGDLQPVELVDLEYQIAQKIHAVTDPAYIRAHDLVDLQLLWNAGPDLNKLRDYCLRTFMWRKQQAWPPLPLRQMSGWEQAYADAREETLINGNSLVLLNLHDAREWLAERITSVIE